MQLDMICTCSAPGILEVEAMRLRTMRRLGLRDPADLATAVALSLAFDFGADAWVDADMWFGVSVKGTRPESWSLYVECDNPWDGLTAALDYAMTRWPEHASRGDGCEADNAQAAAQSATRCLRCAVCALASAEHDATHEPRDYTTGCADCGANMDARIAAHREIDRMWGMDRMG